MKHFKIWSRISLVVMVFVFVLRYTEKAEASSNQIYCPGGGYGSCMSFYENQMDLCMEDCEGAPQVQTCFITILQWSDGYTIENDDCYNTVGNNCGQQCAQNLNSGIAYCAESYCSPYPG